jgi:2-isopropylmalate synthase
MKRREFLKTGAAVLGTSMMADKIFSLGLGGRLAQAAPAGPKGANRKFDTCFGTFNTQGLNVTMPEEVILSDVTMRDGEQTVGVAYSLEEKVDLARRLVALGLPQFQLGRADTPEGRKEAETLCHLGLPCKVEIMAGGGAKDWRQQIDAALACGADIVHTNIATSTYMRNMQGDIQESEVIKRLSDVVNHMRKTSTKIVKISLMDSTRTEEKFLLEVVRQMGRMGIDRLALADTAGTATPEGYFYLVSKIRETLSAFPRPPIIGLHTHNDFGLALSNVFAGVRAGARLIDVCVNGLGERAGNASLAEVALGLEAFYGVNTNIRLEGLFEISKHVEKISGIPIPTNKPFVGEYVSADQSDGHTKAYMENPDAFVGIKPEVYGNKRKLILGVKTGKTTLEHKIRELKLDVPQERYPQILQRIRAASLQNKGKALSDADLIKIIREP